MTTMTDNRHASRSAQTRSRFIEAAEKLFAQRSVDSVSVNEITVAAGQKNRNALQYHFGNREGLLQAIIDKHAQRIHSLRESYMDSVDCAAQPDSRAAARALVMPIAQHIEEDPSGVHYVKILSQLAALNNEIVNPAARSGLSFQDEKRLAQVMGRATGHLGPEEARRRLFLVVSITFHSLADVCRAGESPDVTAELKDSGLLCEQVALTIEALLAASALEARTRRLLARGIPDRRGPGALLHHRPVLDCAATLQPLVDRGRITAIHAVGNTDTLAPAAGRILHGTRVVPGGLFRVEVIVGPNGTQLSKAGAARFTGTRVYRGAVVRVTGDIEHLLVVNTCLVQAPLDHLQALQRCTGLRSGTRVLAGGD